MAAKPTETWASATDLPLTRERLTSLRRYVYTQDKCSSFLFFPLVVRDLKQCSVSSSSVCRARCTCGEAKSLKPERCLPRGQLVRELSRASNFPARSLFAIDCCLHENSVEFQNGSAMKTVYDRDHLQAVLLQDILFLPPPPQCLLFLLRLGY